MVSGLSTLTAFRSEGFRLLSTSSSPCPVSEGKLCESEFSNLSMFLKFVRFVLDRDQPFVLLF